MEGSVNSNPAFNKEQDDCIEESNKVNFTVGSSDTQSEISAFTVQETAPVISIVVNDDEKPNIEESRKYEGFDHAVLMSVIYATILVSIGLVFPTTEGIKNDWATNHWSAMFMVYLFVVSILFILYLQIYILPKSKKVRHQRHVEDIPRIQEEPVAPKPGEIVLQRRRCSQYSELPAPIPNGSIGPDTDIQSSIGGFSVTQQEVVEYIKLRNSSTATLVHEGTSFYLRLGGVAFGVGNIIFVGAQLELQMGDYLADYCPNKQLVYPMFVHLVFILLQSFFIFKHSRINVEIHKSVVHFGLMHVLATNLCVWLRALVEETYHGAHESKNRQAPNAPRQNLNTDYADMPYARADGNCSTKGSLFDNASLYLFPLVLEYSLTVVAIVYTMASEVVVHISQDVIKTVKETLRRRKREEARLLHIAESTSDEEDEEETDGNFNKAHIGLFLGLVMMAGVIISMVIFFHALNSQNNKAAQMIYQISNLLFHIVLLFGVGWAAVKLFKLAYSYNRNNNVDDFLLVLSMKAIIVFELFLLLAETVYISSGEDHPIPTLSLVGALFTMIQSILQTLFIMDGLHRYAQNEEHKKKMPGKGLTTFLIIANLSMWAFKTFQIKNTGLHRQEAFYGSVAWNLILHINMPLMLFYRFHATVCLAHIWHAAYAGEHGQ